VLTVRLTILGSGGWIPVRQRETCAALLSEDGQALLLDAGSGVSRLVERPELLAGCSRLDIVLTHFHLDHTCGLSFLPALQLPFRVAVWGPGAWLYREATTEILERVFAPPQLGHALDDVVVMGDFDPSGQSFGPFALCFRAQRRHSAPTSAIRVNNAFCYCTDTAYDPGNAPFAAEATVLLHEAWSSQASPIETDIHSTAADAARVAADGQVERLVLIHQNPQIPDYTALVQEAAQIFPASATTVDMGALDT
jgi:ribonuclease BN (tRNA processing enzyme)